MVGAGLLACAGCDRACSHYKHTSDGGHFFAGQGAVSALYSLYISELQRSPAGKWPRPLGLRPKTGHAVLLVVRLASLNVSLRALSCNKMAAVAGVFVV